MKNISAGNTFGAEQQIDHMSNITTSILQADRMDLSNTVCGDDAIGNL